MAVILARIRYNHPRLLDILGGIQAVIDSPLQREILAEQLALKMHTVVLNLLKDRLGAVPSEVEAAIRTVQDEEQLDQLVRLAARAADYRAFRRGLKALAPPPRGGG